MKTYKEVNGISFSVNTPDRVIQILSDSFKHGLRIRVFYGDTETGRDWMEENDTIGSVGRSTGTVKIPLLIKTSKSTGGGSILDDCIVKIQQAGGSGGGAILYKHPNYHLPEMKHFAATEHLQKQGYMHTVMVGSAVHANFKTPKALNNWVEFINGKRNSK